MVLPDSPYRSPSKYCPPHQRAMKTTPKNTDGHHNSPDKGVTGLNHIDLHQTPQSLKSGQSPRPSPKARRLSWADMTDDNTLESLPPIITPPEVYHEYLPQSKQRKSPPTSPPPSDIIQRLLAMSRTPPLLPQRPVPPPQLQSTDRKGKRVLVDSLPVIADAQATSSKTQSPSQTELPKANTPLSPGSPPVVHCTNLNLENPSIPDSQINNQHTSQQHNTRLAGPPSSLIKQLQHTHIDTRTGIAPLHTGLQILG